MSAFGVKAGAKLLLAFRVNYVKLVGVATAVVLGPWFGFQVYNYLAVAMDEHHIQTSNSFMCLAMYVLSLAVVCAPDHRGLLMGWLAGYALFVVGHWIVYFYSLTAHTESLAEYKGVYTVATLFYVFFVALPVSYILIRSFSPSSMATIQSGHPRSKDSSSTCLTQSSSAESLSLA